MKDVGPKRLKEKPQCPSPKTPDAYPTCIFANPLREVLLSSDDDRRGRKPRKSSKSPLKLTIVQKRNDSAGAGNSLARRESSVGHGLQKPPSICVGWLVAS